MFPVPIVVLPSLAVLRVQKFVGQKMNEKPPRLGVQSVPKKEVAGVFAIRVG